MRLNKPQVISFILFSGIGFIIDFIFFIILTNLLHINISISNMISAIPAITYVFFISTKHTFKSTFDSKKELICKYTIYVIYQIILVTIISVLAQYIFAFLSTLELSESIEPNLLKIFTKVLITPVTMTSNFCFMKALTRGKKGKTNE